MSRTSTDTSNKVYGGISYSTGNKTSHLFEYYNSNKNVQPKESNGDVLLSSTMKEELNVNTDPLPAEKKKRTKMSDKLKRKPYRLNTRVISPMTNTPGQQLKSSSNEISNSDCRIESPITGFRGKLGINHTPKKSGSNNLEKSKGYSSSPSFLTEEAVSMNRVKSNGFNSKLEKFNHTPTTNGSSNSMNTRLQTGTQTVAHKLSSSRLNIFTTPKNLSHSGSNTSLGTGLFTTPVRTGGQGNRNSGIVTSSNNTISNGNNLGNVFNSPNSLSHMWTELDNLDSFFTKSKDD